MTKQDYAETAKAFRKALRSLRDLEQDFCDVLDFIEPEYEGERLENVLDRYGFWLTGNDHSELQDAILLLERLTGRAFERAQ